MKNVSPLRIAFLDVGHGDSIVLSITDSMGLKRAIIVDTPNVIKTKNYIIENKIDVVDYIIITHFHKDHYSGINSLIESLVSKGIDVKNVCWEKDKVFRVPEEQKDYVMFTTKLLESHLRLGIGCMSKKFDNNQYKNLELQNVTDLNVDIIYPNNFAANSVFDSNINNTSTVLRVEYNGFKIILPGDLEGDGWKILKDYIHDENLIKCDILKMPHHGDYFNKNIKSIGTEELIKYTDPKYAIISTAENKLYNHPDELTVKYLKENNIHVLCTQVTDMCTKTRCEKRDDILKKLNIDVKKYNKNWVPCMGDIILEVDNNIRLVSHEENIISDIKNTFTNPVCCNVEN